MTDPDKPFYVGYLAVPARLKGFLLALCAFFVAAMVVLAFAVGATQDDPGEGAFRFDYGRQTVTGIFQNDPYPMLHVVEGNDRIKAGHTMMLSGPGKRGVQNRAKNLTGQVAQVTGIVLERGTLDMLQVQNLTDATFAETTTPEPVPTEDLGTWRLSGEICDGKCLSGAMRPGRGLAHKACANLCILGGVPPVFVSSQPVAGSEFLMVGAADGGALAAQMLDYVGVFISVEGRVERRGDLLVFLIDATTLEVL